MLLTDCTKNFYCLFISLLIGKSHLEWNITLAIEGPKSSWPTKLSSAANLWYRGSGKLMASLNASLKIKTELEHINFTLLVGSFCPPEPGSLLWAWAGEKPALHTSSFFLSFPLKRVPSTVESCLVSPQARWVLWIKSFSVGPNVLSMILASEERTIST